MMILINEPSVGLRRFYEIIQYETSISIHVPLQDTCALCDRIKVESNHEKNKNKRDQLAKQKNEHLDEVKRTNRLCKTDMTSADEKLLVLTVDLQKALPLPILTVGLAYYKRNFYVYNFGICMFPEVDDLNRFACMYVWSENEGSRGAVETTSCVIDCLKKSGDDVKQVIIWSDKCAGQNRGIKNCIALLRFLSNPTTSIETIDLKFKVSGHSTLPNDAHFGVIERKINNSETVEIPSDYNKIIENAREKKYTIREMTHNSFTSLDNVLKSITNRKKTISGDKVNWLQMVQIRLSKAHPFSIDFKTNFDDEAFQRIDIKKKNYQGSDLFYVEPLPAYEHERPITASKFKDLQDLMPYMSPSKRSFYENLKVTTERGEDSDEE